LFNANNVGEEFNHLSHLNLTKVSVCNTSKISISLLRLQNYILLYGTAIIVSITAETFSQENQPNGLTCTALYSL